MVSPDDLEEIPPSGHLLYGRAFLRRIARLTTYGIRRCGDRHDAVLKLSWHFAIERGYDEAASLAALEDYLNGYAHVSTTRYSKGNAKFLALSLREAKHYVRRLQKRLTPRPRRPAAPSFRAGVLGDADYQVLGELLSDEALGAARAIFSYLARFADEKGRVPQHVDLSARILKDICGERRIQTEDTTRSRASVVALKALCEAGLLTVHTDYSTTRHGRRYCVWYQFGSGVLPAREARGLLLGRRQVEEGELLCFSDGRRANAVLEPRTTAMLGRVEGEPGRPAWWQSLYGERAFTPAEFFEAHERKVLAGPFRERRTSRRPVEALSPMAPPRAAVAAIPPMNANLPEIPPADPPLAPLAPVPIDLPALVRSTPVPGPSAIPEGLSVPLPLRGPVAAAWAAFERASGPKGPASRITSQTPSSEARPPDLAASPQLRDALARTWAAWAQKDRKNE